jgi:hypothetical protein
MVKATLRGRPLKFETPEELKKVIQDYFTKIDPEEYSVTGLALVVGSKQLIQDYEKRPEYGDIIREAKLIVENSYELSLRKHGRTGDIFALKNFGWRDSRNIEHSGEIKGQNPQIIIVRNKKEAEKIKNERDNRVQSDGETG